MIIYNLKLNKNMIFKYVIFVLMLAIAIICFFFVYNKISSKIKKENVFSSESCIQNTDISVIESKNYSNILKEVHEDIETYVGQKISFTGYIYKLENFNENQFVLARDMDLGNHQTVIIGFLCECDDIKNYPEYTWVTITGEITKGHYNNVVIPIIKTIDIKEVEKPDNDVVPFPDEDFIPTSIIY